MTREDAIKMLDNAPASDKPSRINSGISELQAVQIVRKGLDIDSFYGKDGHLNKLLEKRVYQVCRNQRRPRYE